MECFRLHSLGAFAAVVMAVRLTNLEYTMSPRLLLSLPLLLAAGWAQAQAPNCAGVPQALPVSADMLPAVSSELASPYSDLGAPTGVLSRAYDQALSADQVILRLKIETCRSFASVIPAPSPVNPNAPGAYKPRTEFDNTPWRFNMTQNGKRMTADEFDAWMKARGVRVVPKRAVAEPQPTTPTPPPPKPL